MGETGAPTTLNRTISISEAVEGDGSGHTNAPSWISWFERPFQVADPVTNRILPEATGWAMDSAGRGPLNLVGSYVGTAILRLAIQEAGGPDNPIKWGLKPSSLLTLMSSVIGVVAALLMPIAGAIVDHTPHRRIFGIVSGIFAVGFIGVQISISAEKNNWFFILVIDTLQTFALLVHYCAALAYLPDLTTDQEVLSHYTSRFNFKQYVVHFGFVAMVVIMTKSRGNYEKVTLDATVQTARDATIWASALGCLLIGYSWTFLFRQRPALSKVPEGSNLITCGFVQLGRTASKITSKYHALRVFMFSMLWSPEAGAGVVLSITITFLTVEMMFAAVDIAKASLILMASTAVGSLLSKAANRFMNPLNSYRLGLSWLGFFFGLSVFVFTGPERKSSVYGFASLWGIGLGWAYPSQRVLQCSLIPKGQETEMMGLFTFVNQVLGWAPTLIVTLMNENDFDRKWSIMVVCVFCLFSVFCTFFMGDYDEACALVERDSEEKRKEVVDAASHVVKQSNLPETAEESRDMEKQESS
jgi:MFS-type transporter involved in bile tolerance (Atg22 family)